MSQQVAEEVLGRMRERYARRGRKGKGRMLEEFYEQWGYSRKHAIKLLSGKGAQKAEGGRRGRPARYGEEVAEPLKTIWQAGEEMCGKRNRRYFRSGRDATETCRVLRRRYDAEMRASLGMKPSDVEMMAEAKQLLEPLGVSFLDAIKDFAEMRRALAPFGVEPLIAVKKWVAMLKKIARKAARAEAAKNAITPAGVSELARKDILAPPVPFVPFLSATSHFIAHGYENTHSSLVASSPAQDSVAARSLAHPRQVSRRNKPVGMGIFAF